MIISLLFILVVLLGIYAVNAGSARLSPVQVLQTCWAEWKDLRIL